MVCRNELLHEVHNYGINDALLKWIRSFSSEKTFKVRIADKMKV